MKRLTLLPLIAIALAACYDTATSPTPLRTPLLPSFAVNGPTGAHLVTGTPTPSCTVNADLSVSCNSYEIAGVGNTNATADLSATYSATIDCFNPGGQPEQPGRVPYDDVHRFHQQWDAVAEERQTDNSVAHREPILGTAGLPEPELDAPDSAGDIGGR